jgi:HD domain
MSELIKAARKFANGSHQRINTIRNPALQASEAHLKSVAQIVSSVSHTEEMVAAAWLHDIVEDTEITIGDLERKFGTGVASLVDELTVVSYMARGNPAARLALEKEHFAKVSAAAKTIRLADLIDTCRDLSKSKSSTLKRYGTNAKALTVVLEGGDPGLLLRLKRDLEKYALDSVPPDAEIVKARWEPIAIPVSALRVFGRAFTALDIAEPLLSFDSSRQANEVFASMVEARVGVAGVRRDGTLWGYVDATSLLRGGSCEDCRREFASSEVLSAASSFTDVIEVLTRHDWCFVTTLGTVIGVISRIAMQKPAVRMWLFGIITVVEIEFTERVRRHWPEDAWTGLVSAQRLEKATQLRAERHRRKDYCELVECLQLGDKIDILISEPAGLAILGIPTANAAKRVSKQIESLRNSLAHAQGFVDQDWSQIVRLARRVQDIFQGR